MPKTFKEGQRVEIQRETWETAWVDVVYLQPDASVPGWHYVKRTDGGGDRHYVPTRRIRERV